jgi:hypothetical protein
MPVRDRVVVEVTPDPHARLLAAFEVRNEDD